MDARSASRMAPGPELLPREGSVTGTHARPPDLAAPDPEGGARTTPGAVARVDAGARTRQLVTMQRLAGNAAVAELLTGPRPLLQRSPGESPPVEGDEPGEGAGGGTPATDSAPRALANDRFRTIARLVRIAEGGPALSARDNGAAVKAVQQALLDIGYSLLRFQHDGKFGKETRQAIGLFRADRGVGDGDEMDADALLALDAAAPPPGTVVEHYVDYERLFADARFDITLAIGYDEKKGHEWNIERAHEWLEAHQFTQSASGAGEGPVEHWSAVKEVSYPDRSGVVQTRDITVSMQLITPGAGAAAAYGKALSESELTIYAGHARRGIGPDFDPDKSPAENFVLGVNSALHAAGKATSPTKVEQNHYVIDKVNDLEEMTRKKEFDPEKYRIWFFNACSTIAYMDELRGGILPEKMDRKNLDLFGTYRPPTYVRNLTATSLAMVEGILAAETMEEIVRHMHRVGTEDIKQMLPKATVESIEREFPDPFFREGAADNPVAPSATP